MSFQRFAVRLAASGGRTLIEIPFEPTGVWGSRDRYYVHGSVGGSRVRGVIEPSGDRWFMSLGPQWRKRAGLEAGAEVEVALEPESPLLAELAPDLAGALEAEPEARNFFESVAPFYRKNYVRWIESARRAETRARRIAEAVRALKVGELR